ncbi:conserved protein of unknown function [RHS_repeat] [Legionella fallonii LLAP-10]|uniref:LysM domain-containing protein n=2 Tax=Legionella fallonii TaxID=96230 RepID=A0A098G0P4_9GAMM|nr:conserved protein of unknown function [RHS_repeat] [Legionella fallonii LLAP-10]
MTQIFTGEGLGLQGSSLGLGAYGPKGAAALGQGGESVYVNAANGNLVLRQSDGFLADIGFGLDLFQTYNSRGEGASSWRFNLQSQLEVNGEINTVGSSVTRIAEDGHRSVFFYDANKQTYIPQEGGTARLTFNQNGWVYREGSQKTAFHYSQQGQLVEIRDLDGHSVSFNYQNNQLISILDSSGKQKITWSFHNGLLQDVTTTSDGLIIHHLHYEYDEQQRLQKVSRDLGQGKTFWIAYDYAGDSNGISDIRQSDGTTLHIDYDAQGRVKKLVDGEGRVSTYDYQSGATTVTDGLGESWTYYYDDKNRLTAVDGPEQYRIRYYYEGTRLSSMVQGNQVWRFRYNDEGDCIYIEEPSGQITQRIYDAAHRLISETHYQNFDGAHHPINPQTIRYIYDERGHLLFTIASDGTVTERRYDDQGQLISSRCYLRAGYDLSNLPSDELVSREALHSWIAKQNPQEISLIDYRYDWRGQLIEEIHYGQVNATGHGSVLGALTTRSRYDAAGRLVEKSIPIDGGWSITQYIYDDLGRLIQTVDNQHHSQRIEYDDEHQRIIETDVNGLQTIRLYDRSGLLLAVTRLDNSHAYGTTTYRYDAAGRLIAQTGVDGLTTYTFYDQQGRVQAQVNTSGHLTEYLYNDEGFLLKTREYEQRVVTSNWLEQFPSFTAIKPQNSLDDRISQIVYNQYNQIAYRIDAQGAVIGYQYNAQGQVIAALAYVKRLGDFNPEQLLTVDTIQLMTDVNDRVSYCYYDIQGRLAAQINGEGFATSYVYDRLGNLIETCRYFNKMTKSYSGNWSYDKPVVNSRKDIHTYTLYDARGLKVADIDGERYLTEYRYDARGLLQEKCSYEQAISNSILINETTTIEQIRPQIHSNDHHTLYQYNDLGLLIEEKTQSGLVTTYSYDDMGQLITKALTDEHTHAARQQCYRYDALGRVVQSLDEIGAALLQQQSDLSQEQIESIWQKHSVRFEYNHAGLLLSKSNALNQTTYYFYDEARALRYTVNADGAITETGYNHFGQAAFTRTYSAYLKTNVRGLSTEELSIRLQPLQDERFDEFTHYEYNTIGQVIAKYSGTSGLLTHSYNAFGELEFSTHKIDTQHQTTTSFTYDKRGLLSQRIDDVGGIARSNSIHYDAFGWVTKTIDGRLNATSFILNNRGEQVTIVNAGSQFKKISYDAFGRVLKETDFTHAKVIKKFSYDDQNNTLVVTHPENNAKITTQFNAFGDKVSVTDAKGYVTDFHYDEKGQLISTEAPGQTFKKYHYDESGNLIWQEDANGQVIAYRYDASGHILSKTLDPEGLQLTTQYQYDAIGRQLQIIEANGCIKQFTYDNQGNLVQSCVDPQGLNLVTQFIYDDRGLLIRQSEINSHGANKITAYEWDHLGRRIATISDPDGLKLTTRYEYDANDNLITQTDANQHQTHYIYDVNNRCRYEVNARGVVTEHLYDINGNEIQTVTYAKSIPPLSQYNEASLKSVLKEDALHDQYQFRIFDSLGQVVSAFDALGYATTYSYDRNGNLLCISQYTTAMPIDDLKKGNIVLPSAKGERIQYFIYDGLNQLIFKCDNHGYVSQSQYDSSGQLVVNIQYAEKVSLDIDLSTTSEELLAHVKPNIQLDQTTRYAYDKAGRVTIELSAEGIAKSYEYDNVGHVIASTVYATRVPSTGLITLDSQHLIKSANDRTNHFVYDAAGQEVYRVSSEGRVLERRYDGVGNIITELTHATPLHLSHYTLAGIKNALQYQDKQAKITRYEYDAAGRLLTQANAQHAETHYTYDAQGNVLSKSEANHALWTYLYDETNQLIESRSPSTKVITASGQEQRSIITRHSYDSFGNLTAVVRDAEGLKQTLLYDFDNNNHKIKTIYPDVKINAAGNSASNQKQEVIQTLTEEIKYNAFGEVIATSDKAGNWKHFALDNKGLLIFSVDTQGGLTQYKYDAFGRVIEKVLYANVLKVGNDFEYNTATIEKASRSSQYDRQEFYVYNLDNQVIEVRRDPVRMYNSKTGHYDSSLQPTTKNTYNAFGELIKSSVKINESEWAETYTYYDQDGHQTAVIDAEGYLTTYHLNVFGEVDRMTEHALAAADWNTERYNQGSVNAHDRTVTYSYDALGQLTSKTLKQVRFERLKAGTNTYETITQDVTTTYGYDALGHLITTTDAKGNTAYCYYNELGQLIAKVAPRTQDGRAATTYAYDALGHLVETRRWAQGVSEADAEHFVLKGASHEDILTRQEYDVQGQVITETDGIKHQVYYSYDANGNLARSWTTLKQVDNSLLIQDKRYRYDSEQNLLQTATVNNFGVFHTDDAQYNAFGEVVAKGMNGSYSTHVDYDRLGRVWRSNTQGHYQIFVYDLMNNVTQVVTSTNTFSDEYQRFGVDLSGKDFERAESYDQRTWLYDLQRQNNVYDSLGHLLSQTKEFSVPASEQINTGYLKHASQSQTVDRWGNMLSFTNSLGFQTRYEYNAFNQVVKQELPEVQVVDEHGVGSTLKPVNTYAYDELGQAIAMVDANGHVVSKEYDALGRVILERDARGYQRAKHYNLLEQLTQSVNELGAVTSYTYDNANRLVAINTANTHQQYDYDEAGQLIKQQNGEKEQTLFWYDTLGNQVKRRDARGYETNYKYDAFGRKTEEKDALGHTQFWVYNNQGQLEEHTDLGGRLTHYDYNTNGLLIEEHSTSGKHTKYFYQGDGELTQFVDETKNEIIRYTYDAQGQMTSKDSGRGAMVDDGWIRETDYYQYDALGRLIEVRRRNPADTDKNFPNKEHALLSIDYEYDAVGNIRHTQVSAHDSTKGKGQVHSDDYYLYDENNRMTVNKGQLVNGQIMMTSSQGSTVSYDAAGNIKDSVKYEHGLQQKYHYEYNKDNQLELIQKNDINLQSKRYDKAGRVYLESSFDAGGNLAQSNIMSFRHGVLEAQRTVNGGGVEVSHSSYGYDVVGNLTDVSTYVKDPGKIFGYTSKHHYSYALWDGYLQSLDEATQIDDRGGGSNGSSRRIYDVNGQLEEARDEGGANSSHYLNSTFEGMKARKDKEGQISYLSVAGKTIGDLHVDQEGNQQLTVYGGFTPTGTQQKAGPAAKYSWSRPTSEQSINGFLNGGNESRVNGVAPDAPQDNLGSYTVQSGDSLENIALQVYGDSSLWYLLADANGISDRGAQAGSSEQLHIGQRLNIPPVATGQHHSSGTHKVLNGTQMIGDTSATVIAPAAPPPLPKKHGLFSKIVVAVVSVVATVMTAGIMGALAGVGATSGGLFATGMEVLGGSLMHGLGATLGAGFTAGFIGNIASQGVAKALELQESISLKGALITGLATAASSGLLRGLNGSKVYQQFTNTMDELSVSKAFSISSAAQLMEQNALSQSISLSLQKHQHFDWEQLAVSGVTAGLMGGALGSKLDKILRGLDHNTGMLSSELRALTNAGLNSAVAGSQLNALDVLQDNLGAAIGSAITDKRSELEQSQITGKDLARLKLKEIDEMDEYCPIPTEEGAYSPIPEGTYERFHQEILAHQRAALEQEEQDNYEARELSGSEGYESAQPHLSNQQTLSLGNYERLSFDSDLFKSSNDGVKELGFESQVYWNSKEHGVGQFVGDSNMNIGLIDFVFKDNELDINSLSNKKEIWVALNSKFGTKINFLAINNAEGGQAKRGYLPMEDGKVLGKSGITIATGFDIGQYSKRQIKDLKFPKALEKKLLPFAELIKDDAKKLLPLANQTIISTEEANLIDFKIKRIHLNSAIKDWNANKFENTPAFQDLTSGQQTVLFSRTFHQGPSMPRLPVSQKFYRAALENNWVEAEKHLRNYNVKAKWYVNRVNNEADILKRERLLK